MYKNVGRGVNRVSDPLPPVSSGVVGEARSASNEGRGVNSVNSSCEQSFRFPPLRYP